MPALKNNGRTNIDILEGSFIVVIEKEGRLEGRLPWSAVLKLAALYYCVWSCVCSLQAQY